MQNTRIVKEEKNVNKVSSARSTEYNLLHERNEMYACKYVGNDHPPFRPHPVVTPLDMEGSNPTDTNREVEHKV